MKQLRGVSIVICCYNSATRLKPTLAYLSAQVGCKGIPWEVIVVDNASSDDTAQVVLRYWLEESPVPLRVVFEPELGLSNARRHGISEARYEYVSFVDDDNWVAQNWVATVYEIMEAHPNVGACGGTITAIFEENPPNWFDHFATRFAVGKQFEHTGYIAGSALWGAGLTIRKSAWEELERKGFTLLLSDRNGKNLNAGGDSEICYALQLGGWKLWFDENIQLIHYMPSKRLTWKNFCKMSRGFGISKVTLDLFYKWAVNGYTSNQRKYQDTWIFQVLVRIWFCLQLLPSLRIKDEGSDKVLDMHYEIGFLQGLIKLAGKYNQRRYYFMNAPWINK